jgi:hypothetical protein
MSYIIDTAWDIPPYWLTVESSGVLYICVRNGTSSRIYKSENYGHSFLPLYEGTELGQGFVSCVPTSAGYVGCLSGRDKTPVGLDGNRGSICKRTISGTEGIWIAAKDTHGFNDSYVLRSVDGGVTFTWSCNNNQYGGGAPEFGRMSVFDLTHAWMFVGVAGGLFSAQVFTPAFDVFSAPGDTWIETAIASYNTHRCLRAGADLDNGRVVLGPDFGTHTFAVSNDYGATFVNRAYHADMQAAVEAFNVDIACNQDLILTVMPDAAVPGVYRSVDFGVTWAKVMDLPGAGYNGGISIDPDDSTHAWTWGTDGFFCSNDGGATWTTCGLIGSNPTVNTLDATSVR